jgi:peptidyl-prolyl cis-trans isomerase B (cyclophilin B)
MIRPPHAARRLTVLAASVLLAACTSGGGGLPTVPAETSAPPATPTPAPTHPGPTYPPGCPTSQPPALAAADKRTVTIETPKGDIEIAVDGSLSPIATGNFVALASCGYYDGVVFHRVVPGFVIQGGDGQFGRSPEVIPDLVGTGGPPYRIQDEPVTGTYQRGTVAMARTAEPNSVGSQFFIVLDDAAAQSLAGPGYNNYQIVGTVTSGMDAVDAIAAAADAEIPSQPIPMTRVTVSTP